jgi:EmrB/QacA subfamily drug resistance transporter
MTSVAERGGSATGAAGAEGHPRVPGWELPRGRLVAATGGTMLALLLAALDQTVVGTALPRIVSELKGLNEYPWVITAYLVCSTSMTPVAGKLGDMFGRKPLLLGGMAGFMGASALCGLSQSMGQLILFRGVQGLFAGFLFATVFGVVADLYPPQRRGRIQGLFGSVWGVASILGPPTGGLLTDNAGWRWVFYINIPVGLVAATMVVFALPYVRSRASWRQIDFLGAGTLAGFLAPLLIALSLGRDLGWTSPAVLGLLVLAAAMLAAFLITESHSKSPILPLALFRNQTFSAAMVIAFFSAFGMFGTIIYGPLVFQGVLGVSATNSGALAIPMSIGQVAASVLTGTLMWRLRHYRFLGTVGIATMIVGMWLMSQVTVGTSYAQASLNVLIIGLGLGTTFPLTMNSVQNALPRQFIGVASSQVQFFRAVGGTIATAVLGTVLTQRLPGNINAEIASLRLSPQTTTLLTQLGIGNPQTLFDPTNIDRARAALPPGTATQFEAVLGATRLGLAHTLHDVFLTGAVIVGVAMVGSVFLREVQMRATKTTKAAAPEELPRAMPAELSPGGTTAVPVEEGARREVASAVAADGAEEERLDEAIQRIGSKYLTDLMTTLEAEIERRFESQLAAKDQLLSELKERVTTAEGQHDELQDRIRGLERELEGRALELDQLLARHREDLNTLGSALARLGVAVERSKGRVGMPAEDTSHSVQLGAEPDKISVR